MFNSNGQKKTTAKKMNTNSTGSKHSMPSVNMISEGTHLKGTLKTKNDIRIAGTLEGEARAKGKLIISSSGKIDGDVKAVNADIAGKLEGEIRVTNKLILRKSAVVDGDIYTKNLLVEEGAQINGACRMGEDQVGSISLTLDDKQDDSKSKNGESKSNLKAVEAS